MTQNGMKDIHMMYLLIYKFCLFEKAAVFKGSLPENAWFKMNVPLPEALGHMGPVHPFPADPLSVELPLLQLFPPPPDPQLLPDPDSLPCMDPVLPFDADSQLDPEEDHELPDPPKLLDSNPPSEFDEVPKEVPDPIWLSREYSTKRRKNIVPGK